MNIEFIKEEVVKAARKANLKNCRIVLFGSYASAANRLGSDIDLGLWCYSGPKPGALSLFEEALENSRLPCQIDMVLLNKTSAEFAAGVLEKGITLYEDHDS